ncbi:hypothetical protein TNCV_4661611 [Trichonephila clavipes]|uniref:Uncharacterized protein n=1 Tax=Trichonephila clavipes TaxID=2585209 RepID=A0A8X6SCX7_TRICX|nr:hypothetical protein TNCV_4661611 [Trichonephila clavipes]
MEPFANNELEDRHLIYGLVEVNAGAAQRLSRKVPAKRFTGPPDATFCALMDHYEVIGIGIAGHDDEAHFWLNGYVNKQNCHIWSEANPQVFVETPLHPEKLTVWCALWAGGILLQKR